MRTSNYSWRFFLALAACIVAAIGFLARAPAQETASPDAARAEPIDCDVLLQGGLILDGSGEDGLIGDVAIAGERIVAVGKFEVRRAGRTIDCRGLAIAPGFIDLHSHSDGPIVRPATRANVNYLTQGCTTVVTGNCGGGPIDVADYFRKIEAAGAGTNVIHLLPQGALRSAVLRQDNRDPTEEELARMKELTEQAMQDGAWGMSTGLIYVPSSYAKTEELIEIAKVVARHGGLYASHIRGEGSELLDAVNEAIAIGREAKLPVHISHFKAAGSNVWGTIRIAAELIEKARQEGQAVTADQYPYIASSTSLEATLIPTWARAGGRNALLRRLRDQEDGKRLREAIAQRLKPGDRIVIASFSGRPEYVGREIREIARDEGRDVIDLAVEMFLEGSPRCVKFSMSEEDVRYAMRLPWVATASDGSAMIPSADKPHPRSFGTFPRKLGHYARDEGVISLAQAVRSASGLPAEILGLKDRGYLSPGWMADVTVFDPRTIRDRATFEEPFQYSQGVRWVFVNGTPAIYDGVPTGALTGRPLRRESAR